eukprot:GHVS01069445.1.p2 GENE.GHVS01069445.1~~GHVS01069445.1.p2  ORF type:complete len:157 (+),score=17.44 GHVS01069445.1:1254-1724(+)
MDDGDTSRSVGTNAASMAEYLDIRSADWRLCLCGSEGSSSVRHTQKNLSCGGEVAVAKTDKAALTRKTVGASEGEDSGIDEMLHVSNNRGLPGNCNSDFSPALLETNEVEYKRSQPAWRGSRDVHWGSCSRGWAAVCRRRRRKQFTPSRYGYEAAA